MPTHRTAPHTSPLPNMGGGSGGKRALWALGAGVRPSDAWNPWRHLEGHTFHRTSPPAPAKTQGLCDTSHPPCNTPWRSEGQGCGRAGFVPCWDAYTDPSLVCALRLACCPRPSHGLALGGRLSDISLREESVPFDGTAFWQEEILNCLANQALNRTSLSEGEQP